MKNTLKNSALIATLLLSMGSVTSVFAAETKPSTTTSTGKINFLENDDKTDPLNPTDPDQPVDPDNPIDPDDPGNKGTGNKGPLSLDYVSNIDFGTAKLPKTKTIFNAKNDTPFVQVTDSRVSGGWKLTAALTTPFTSEGKATLKGAIMHWMNGDVVAQKANSSVVPTLDSKDVQLQDASEQQFMSVDPKTPNAGKGTWLERFQKTTTPAAEAEDLGDNSNVTLEVPAGAATTSALYTGTITWTLSDVAA